MPITNSKLLDRIWLTLLLAAPVILWILPANFFDSEEGIVLCPSRLFFDVECFGCGMTRAVMHLHHFEISDALFYNYGVVAIYPALVLLWGHWTLLVTRRLGLIRPKGEKVS